MQLAASALFVLWCSVDWILWDPHLGMLRDSSPAAMRTWIAAQSWIIGVAMPAFAIGYLWSKLIVAGKERNT